MTVRPPIVTRFRPRIRRNVAPSPAAKAAASGGKTASENVGPIVESLRNTATAAQAAAARAQEIMGSAPRQGYDLGKLIEELTRAADSVRALASYLEENPDALLKGRGKPK